MKCRFCKKGELVFIIGVCKQIPLGEFKRVGEHLACKNCGKVTIIYYKKGERDGKG